MNFKIKIIIISITFLIGLSTASFASAAFPTISGTNSGNNAASLSHTVNLPANIVAGDLLVVSFSTDGSPTATFPAGWNSLFSTANSTANRLSVSYKIADGTEGSSITVALGGATTEPCAYTAYRITGHYAGIGPAYGTVATGSSTTPNPPTLTPSWGALDTLWLAVYGWDYNRAHSAYPANYTLSQLYQRYNTTAGCGIASAGYNLNTATQDPGVGTIGVADTWVANTLAVRPFGSASTITLASGTDASSATVAPSSTIRDAGSFTLQSSANPDYVTAMTVTLAGSGTPYDGVSEVRITSDDGSVTYFSAVTNPSSNTVNFSGGRGIPITSTQTQFKIRITPKTHANMAVPNGASYALSPYVSSWTLSYADTQTGSDSNSNTLTIDNTSPSGATSTSGTGGIGNVDLNWTTSASSDFSRSVVLRWSGSTAGSEVPAEGTDYTAGSTISTATVACVRTADSSSTAVTDAVDGYGGGGGCSTTSLLGGDYSYKIFQKDSNGNYDTGVTFTGSPFTVTAIPFATQIYRSVGPDATDALATDSSHTYTVSVTSGVATFSTSLYDNIGVGDAVIIDTGGTNQTIDVSDTLLFISERNSPTSYNLQTHTGGAPSNISSNDTYQIYRAYTSLANAEAGTINSTLSGLGFSFNGGNRDLVTNNEEWNIACYANGTTADTTAVMVNGWTTSATNYLKIYTPVGADEVGTSQRHDGKWDDYKYNLKINNNSVLYITNGNVRVDGIQMKIENVTGVDRIGIQAWGISETADLYFSNNIIQGDSSSATGINEGHIGIEVYSSGSGVARIWNNIVYEFGADRAISAYDGEFSFYIYNNTVYNCYHGINRYYGTAYVKNNIVQNTSNLNYYGTFDASSGYNISSDTTAPGTNSKVSTNVEFVDEANKDFHLAQTDTAARQAGTNLTADANLPITTDIDGQLRNPAGVGWDIGADEGTKEFVTTVMQAGGNFSSLSSWEDNVDSDLVASTTRVFPHGGITGTIIGGNAVTGVTSGATATVVYVTSTQILLSSVSGIFQSGEVVRVSVGNQVTISDNGNPASAVAKIDGSWSGADTTAVDINGWTSGADNYIRVYTTATARHNGKWDTGKYRLENDVVTLRTQEGYTKIDGLQIIGGTGIYLYYNGYHDWHFSYNTVSNNIIKDYSATGSWNYGIRTYMSTGNSIFNNIVYDYNYDNTNEGIDGGGYGPMSYYYNNTVYNSYYGFIITNSSTNVVLKNNIAQNCTDGFSGGHSSSDYNISDISSDAPNATFTGGFANVQFVDETNYDFHLDADDDTAINVGANLSAYFNTDIDGQNRGLNISQVGSDDFTTNPSTRWTNLSGSMTWASGAYSSDGGATQDYAVYNNPTASTTQYVKVNAYQTISNGAKGVVMRSTGTASDGYYTIVTGQADNNAHITYANETGWVEDMARASLPYAFSTTSPGDSIGFTIEGSGTGTVARIWVNPVNNAPFSPSVWDNVTDAPDVIITLASYAGSNFANTGKRIGLGSWDATTYDNFYGGSISNAWDIGADEAATRTFRSVGPNATALLASDSSHANTVTLTSSTAVFSATLPDNIGVGDAVIIDTGGTDQTIDASDTLFFIKARNSATSYQLQAKDGTIPSDIASNDTYQIYRAYTSLADAESGTKNTSIPITFNGGNRDLVTNNEEWNIACYGNGTTADSTAVTVDGWTMGLYNILKVYTPVSTNEVGVSQRHDGKWDDNKYKLEYPDSMGGPIYIMEEYLELEGLQVSVTNQTYDKFAIDISPTNDLVGEISLSNNIIKAFDVSANSLVGIGTWYNSSGSTAVVNIFNNIIYDFNGANSVALGLYYYATFNVSNNTIYNVTIGCEANSWDGVIVKNNIVQECSNACFYTPYSWGVGSGYNISSDITAPGTNSKNSTNVLFIDETNRDFHLSQSDTAAKNAGTDLSTYFATDIDGASRNASVNNWDIGADETVTQIYRSVGPSATGLLASDSSHANTVTLTSGTAVFSASLPDNIGVGDVVIIDNNGGAGDQSITSADTLLFISGRNSDISYNLRTQTGAVPADITINDTYNIYRAYTSFFNAEAGTINSTLSGMGFAQFNGGNRDILANNEEWNIAAYANGTTADTAAVTIDGWNTAQQNFIKLYTPVNATEVGVSQRHNGKWGDNYYKLQGTTTLVTVDETYVILEGLQFDLTGSSGYIRGVSFDDLIAPNTFVVVSHSIFRGTFSGTARPTAINAYQADPALKMFIFNNIIYGMNNPGQTNANGVYADRGLVYIYNNTVYGCYNGLIRDGGTWYAKNNIAQSNTIDYLGIPGGSSFYNISEDGTANGTSPKINTAVSFVDEPGYDFHLAQTDTAARQAGTNLTADSILPITTDIDGQLRNPAGVGWDIGADEGTKEFVTTVMQTGGNFSTLSSWEDNVDSDLVANTTRVFSHGGITGTITGGNTVTGQTSGATATVIYATSTQILLSGIATANFQSGETVQVSVGNSVVISDNGNPASAVAKIDGAWSSADTTGVSISGWITGGDNYIKVYTTTTARHSGKWDDTKYRMQISNAGAIWNYEQFLLLDGLQFYITTNDRVYRDELSTNNGNVKISNNIMRGGGSSWAIAAGSDAVYSISNNIIYDFYTAITGGANSVSNFYVYNNTVYNMSGYGFWASAVRTYYLRNNLIENSTTSDYYFSGGPTKDVAYCISSDGSADDWGGAGNKINQTVSFISTTAGSEDFHLNQSDTAAKNSGTDLSTYFTTDIDGATRNVSLNNWDIGADETATQIFRSVGPSATAVLASDSSHANTVTLTSGVATFSASLPDNIGVGDVVLIDTNGGAGDQSVTSADTLLIIKGRNSATSYQLQTTTGAIPSDISINDTYQIYRAHTTLANAEDGTINSTLSGMGFAQFNGGNRDLMTNNEAWNIACYANGTTADTTALTIDGWNTGAYNFLKAYTPYLSSEVGTSQRHSGKWDDGKYRLSTADPFGGSMLISSSYTIIDGIQIKYTAAMSYGNLGVVSIGDISNSPEIKNSIITSVDTYSNNIRGIVIGDAIGMKQYINNNIIYGSGLDEGIEVLYSGTAYVYNNTIHGAVIGINRNSGTIVAKNNIVQNCTNGYNGTFDASSDYNISDLATDAPGTNSKNSTNVLFIDETNGDFHLSQSDTAAKNAGTDLSTYFTTDIDGATRNASINNWDIGADETATQIYRSVGPEYESTLAENYGAANTITISSGVANFVSDLPDNVGVGDFIVYDSNNDNNLTSADAFAFIHGRTSANVYTIKTQTGATPANLPANDNWAIFRAYTSLADAESGTINPSISAEGVSFSGGDRDLLANNEEWNITCYGNGTIADTTNVVIADWDTGAYNYLKIYTPVSVNEVGISQRHKGRRDDNYYNIKNSLTSYSIYSQTMSHVEISGLQILPTNTSGWVGGIRVTSPDAGSYIKVHDNIIAGLNPGNAYDDYFGIILYEIGGGISRGDVYNNIVYDFKTSNNHGFGIYNQLDNAYVYNNTIYNSDKGIVGNWNFPLLKNNIVQDCTDGYYLDGAPSWNASSDYNISDLAADAPGTNSKNSTNVLFVNETGKDFHLAQTDTAARQAGTNLTADPSLPIATDIDGQLRNAYGTGWDIGADEGTKEFVTTIMQGGGNFASLNAWEDAVDSDLVANTTRVFSHGGITGTIIGGNTVTGQTSGATATVVYATSTQILLSGVSGIFQTGEVVRVSVGNQVTISDNGNPASAAAKIDGAWTVADNVPVDVDGWGTGNDNYIKIYTTGASRHTGKWDDTKYHMYYDSYNPFLGIYQDFVTLDGLQIERHSDNMPTAIEAWGDYLNISNNIIKSTTESLNADAYGIWTGWDDHDIFIYNNIIYGFTGTSGAIYVENGINIYIYNNTLYNNEVGLHGLYVDQVDVKNNIVEGCIGACYFTTYDGPWGDYSSHNISSDSTAPGSSASKINAEVEFVSTTAGEEDFHLASNDRFAKDAGTDLSTYFTTDIDGMPRAGAWDIGADETATQIYRSVGPSATGLLDSDSSHTRNVTLTGGIATFSASVPNNVGVGDAVIIDTNGGAGDQSITSADTLLFISKRNSATSYQLQTASGTTPSDIAINDTYQIYRAHTSLANAESGTINSTLSTMGFAQFNGGNRDLVANNEQWNIACYANGTTADATSVDIDGWNTGENNFIRVYTPVKSDEVGVTQRHDGKWDANKYKLEFPIFNFFDINEEYVRLEGLQMSSGNYGQNVTLLRFGFFGGPASSDCQVSNSIFKESDGSAISILGGSVKVWNNILYNITADSILSDYALTSPIVSIYNNTINACNKGINANGGLVRAKNNVAQDCTDGYVGTFDGSSDYNISDLAADAPGTNSKNSTNVLFLDEVGYDFRLSSDDTAANGAGLNLSTDTNLSFFDDIRGQARPKSPDAWSIGACEPKGAGKIKLENNIKMEGDMKFE